VARKEKTLEKANVHTVGAFNLPDMHGLVDTTQSSWTPTLVISPARAKLCGSRRTSAEY